MKEWVVVPAAHASEWPRLAELALAYVSRSLTSSACQACDSIERRL